MGHPKKHLFIYGSLILLAGCANYSASALSNQAAIESTHSLSENEPNVLLSWKFFNKKECEKYLGRNLISSGYVPVQITVQNNSSDPMYLSTDNFSIPLPSLNEVTKKAHTSTAGRVVAWGVGGLILWPLMIPAVYDGICSSQANDALDKDYDSKTLKEHTIRPHTSFSRIVFVPKEKIKQTIEMFLLNEKTNEKIVFSVLKSQSI